MKKLLLLSALFIFACSSDSEGNPCIYEPTLTTETVTDITETSATLNGVISIVSENCDVPNNTEQGFVYSTEIQPTLEDTQVNVNGTNISTTIEGLTPNTTYYVRAFLTNNLGDFYGDEISFTTIDGIINCDGNPVPTIVYGTQEWTVENACHITYRDGTPIPQVTDDEEWSNLTTGAWCYYDNDPTKPRLYNWYAVMGIYDEASLNNPSLRKEFADRQLSTQTFNDLRRGKYEPYFPSKEIQDRFREISRNLGTANAFNAVAPTLRAMRSQMRFLTLDDIFDIDLNDFSLGSSGGIQTPPLPSTPQPVVNTQANVQNVNPTTNLTSTETALLSPEEQVIRARLRRTT